MPGGSSNQNGTFKFSDARTGLGATAGVGVANLALGLADSYTEIGQRAYTIYRGFLYEWFAQDSWKVNQKLTSTTAFARPSRCPTKLCGATRSSSIRRFTTASTAPKSRSHDRQRDRRYRQSYNGMVIPGSGWPSNACGHGVTQACGSSYNSLFQGLPSYYGQINYQFQPRAGVAYKINDKTVIRAGIGRYLTRFGPV